MSQIVRHGNFTSGDIVLLNSCDTRELTAEEKAARPKKGTGSKTNYVPDPDTLGQAALTYIKKKNMERKLGRPLNTDVSARPLEWGKFMEWRAYQKLGFGYSLASRTTIQHPEIEYWVGTPDGTSEDTVYDIKCPFTLESFCTLYECKTIEEVRQKHDDGEKYFYQLVSNSILTNKQFAELIVYMPYKSELDEIRDEAGNWEDKNKVAWIHFGSDEDLPHLVDGGVYQNLFSIRFEVSEHDKEHLKKRVLLAGKLLEPRQTPVLTF